MKVYLPNSAFLGNIDGIFLKSIDPTDETKLEVSFNQSWQALHPVVLSMVAALGLKMSSENKPIICQTIEAKSKNYLARMGLLNYLDASQRIAITEHDPAGRFIPLRNITNNEDLKCLLEDITPLFHTIPEQAKSINYVLSELIRNVFEHSFSKNGAVVCVQNFKQSKKNKKPNRVSIGVADTGIGIRKSLEKSYPTNDDLQAVKLSLVPGVTGTTRVPGGSSINAGAGLFFIKSIAKVNRNFFMIYSGNGMYKLLTSKSERTSLNADPDKDRHSERKDLPYWQGTAVGIDISLEQSEPFVELIKEIGRVYSIEKKEKKKSFYKARFI